MPEQWLTEVIAAYDRQAEVLSAEYARAKEVRGDPWWASCLPPVPARVADIGAGSGVDSDWLARRGYHVTAVEPSTGMARVGRTRGTADSIVWVTDALPDLAELRRATPAFDFVVCNGVLQHIPSDLHFRAVESLWEVTAPGGSCALSLRLGPAPPDRPMFPVDPEAVCSFSTAAGFAVERRFSLPDFLKRPGVSWTMVVLRRASR